MGYRLSFRNFLLSFLVLIVIQSCNLIDFDQLHSKLFPKLKIDEAVQIAAETIPASGGEIIVEAGDELNGLSILVPPNSYDVSKQFKISTSKIKSHKLGDNFHPISPLIQIGNEGGYADSIMELKIPITLEDGQIPLGFYYNEEDGSLEGIPVKEYDNQSITLITRHFMSVADLSYSSEKSSFIENTSNIIIGSIAEQVLKDIPVVSTSFEVGKDNWEFGNHGSYIAPWGHCAGQNIAALWYYYEQKLKTNESLNGKFSTVSSLEYDNFIGYKFCSVVQADLEWDGLVNSFCSKYIDKNQELDLSKFYTLAATMLITGEPQAVGIYRLTGYTTKGEPLYAGHALICYKVDLKNGKLYICDPNWPKDPQEILLQNNKFKPYTASSSTKTSSYSYEYIRWYAKTALIEWDQIGKRYSEMLDSTIGYVPPYIFPDYNIWALEKEVNTEIYNADQVPFVINNDTLRIVVESDEVDLVYNVDGKSYIDFVLYDEAGKNLSVVEKKWQKYALLEPGWNKIGILIRGWKEGTVDKNGNLMPLFIDFKWLKVYRSDLQIQPDPLIGEIGEELSMEAISGVQIPDQTRYVWNFGDGTDEVVVENDNKVGHTYTYKGKFKVSVKCYNSNTNELIAQAESEARIGSEVLNVFGINFSCSVHEVTLTRTDTRVKDGEIREITGESFSYEASAGFSRSELQLVNGVYLGEIINYESDTKEIDGQIQLVLYDNDSLDIFINTTVNGSGKCPESIWLDELGASYDMEWEENFECSYLGLRYSEDISSSFEIYDNVHVFRAWPSQVGNLNMSYTAKGVTSKGDTWSSEYISHKVRTDGIGGVKATLFYE